MWSESDIQQVSREKCKVQRCNTQMHKCMQKISEAEAPQAGPWGSLSIRSQIWLFKLYARLCKETYDWWDTKQSSVAVSYGEMSAGGLSASEKGVQFEDNPEESNETA